MIRREAMGRCDKQARNISGILLKLIDDIVLTCHDETYIPERRFDDRGIRGFWHPLPDNDSGDWDTCVIEIHERRPPQEMAEILLACEVVPGISGTAASVDWRGEWKTRLLMYYDLAAALDNRSVDYLTQFQLEDQ